MLSKPFMVLASTAVSKGGFSWHRNTRLCALQKALVLVYLYPWTPLCASVSDTVRQLSLSLDKHIK